MAEEIDPLGFAIILDRIKNPSGALVAIGARLVADSQRAFSVQAFGTFKWESRYPRQSEPWINFAGGLSDLNRGKPVKDRRFDRRPALRDSNALFNSIAPRTVSPREVEVGSSLPYASQQHLGLESRQRIRPSAIPTLDRQLRRAKGKKREGLEKLRARLSGTDQLITDIVERPIVGLTDETAKIIPKIIARYIETGKT